MCLLFSDQMQRKKSEFSLIAMNIQSNLSGSSLERDPQPLQIEIYLFEATPPQPLPSPPMQATEGEGWLQSG
jgi:hypothetical protein